MKYIIYELIQPEHLRELVREEYGYTRVLYRNVFGDLSAYDVEKEHDTMDSAIAEIQNNKRKLRGKNLIILPVMRIPYDAA